MTLMITITLLLVGGLLISILSIQLPRFDAMVWEESAKDYLKIEEKPMSSFSPFSLRALKNALTESFLRHLFLAVTFTLVCSPVLFVLQDPISICLVCAIVSCLMLAALIDLKHKYIPDVCIVVGIFFAFSLLIYQQKNLTPFVLGAMLGYGIIAFCRIVFLITRKQESIGLGDAKFMAMAGALVGIDSIFYLLTTACIIGALFMLLSNTSDKKMAFGPSIAISILFFLYQSILY